jgi:hypothetical protein
MEQNGVTIRQSLYNFGIAPSATDDEVNGYVVGSLWTLDDSTTYVCTVQTAGLAVWVKVGLTAGVVEITSTDLATLSGAGELSLTTIYIVTDAPYRIALKAEAVNKIGANGTIIDLTYSGSVYYDLATNTIVNGTMSDIDGNTWNGCLPSATIFAISGVIPSKNTFYQGAITNQLGESCDGNIFNAKASENTLGDICYYNTFGQRAINNILAEGCNHNFFHQNSCLNELGVNCRNNVFGQGSVSNILGETCEFNTFGQSASLNTLADSCSNNIFEQGSTNNILGSNCIGNVFGAGSFLFVFGAGLQNVTVEPNFKGYDYTDLTDFAFLYGNDYAATIFTDGTNNYHRYYDPANNRIVVTLMSAPFTVSYIGGGGGGGGVTSVDLTMPAAFSVSGNPVTSSGTLAVTAAGIASQYVRGDGQLANFPTSTGGGSSVSYYLNGSVSQGTFGGSTYYEMSKTPILGGGTTFTRLNSAGNGLIAQFITDAGDPNLLNIPAGNWNLELFFRASSGGGSPSYYVELYKYDGAAFTLIATDSLTPEGITNGTTLDTYFTALAVPQTTLASTDRLALRVFVNTSGRDIELHTENGHLCQVITTFTTGLTALNGLTEQVQTFAVGTTGTDFAISSASSTHTFNLPTASASNRGALSSADWSAFNALRVEEVNLQDIGTALPASTYTIVLDAKYARTINELTVDAGAGTCTLTMNINGTPVTGISAVSVSTTEATYTATAANAIAVGDIVTIVTTSNSGLANLQITVKTTR